MGKIIRDLHKTRGDRLNGTKMPLATYTRQVATCGGRLGLEGYAYISQGLCKNRR